MNNIVERDYFLVRTSKNTITTSIPIDLTKKYDHCAISSLSIPKTFYVLTNNCTLRVDENGVISNIAVEKGNYNVRSLATILSNLININPGTNWTYTFSFPSQYSDIDTGKYTFTVAGNGGIQPKFYTEDLFLSRCLGLEKGIWYSFSGNKLLSSNIVNFQSYDEIILKSDIVRNQNQVLQEIYTSGEQYNSSIVWSNQDLLVNAKNIVPNTSNVYTFRLLDGYNDEPIDLNGSEWSFMIVFFKISNIDEVIKKYIDYKLFQEQNKLLE